MSRVLIVKAQKTFRITVPDEAKITFGPWSPQTESSKYASDKALVGTLRVYANDGAKASVLAVFSGVTEYRDTSIEYEERIVVEEGSTVWNSDRTGYKREEKVKRDESWALPLGDGRDPDL